MRSRRWLASAGVAIAIGAWCAMGGAATAAFPDFHDCPSEGLPAESFCLDVQSQSGEVVIKGFNVPLDHSLEIRGAIRAPEGTFVPPAGTNGFFAQPVNVPGGLLGIELPIGLNQVLATAQLAGPASSIRLGSGFELRLPIKLRLSNPLIGSNCHIGTDSNPVMLHLITGTTEPPPPNMPISGRPGRTEFIPPSTLVQRESLYVENSFAVPGASGCGGLGLIDLLIDAKLKLPSAAGNNTVELENNAGIELLR